MTLDEAIAILRAEPGFREVQPARVHPAAQQLFGDTMTSVNIRFLREGPDPNSLSPAGVNLFLEVPYEPTRTAFTGSETAFWEGRRPASERGTFRERMLSELRSRLASGEWLTGKIVDSDDRTFAVFQVEELVAGAGTLKAYIARLAADDSLMLTETDRGLSKTLAR